MTQTTRRTTLKSLAAIAGGTISWPHLARAQATYPTHPIRMLMPLGAGSASDVAGRIVANKMATNLGQAIVVENVLGAAGIVGTDKLAKAAPDGYTLGGLNDAIMTMLPGLQPKLPWDIGRDFVPVSLVAAIEWCLVAHPSAPWNTAADFIKAAKAAPNAVSFGSGGVGSPQHIAMALFASEAGITLNHVPYKGASDLATGLASGQVPIAFQGLASVNGLVKGKRLKILGVGTPQRMPQYAEVPTIAESGLPGFEFNSWFAFVFPAGTPAEIVARMSAETHKAVADPAVREQLIAQGLTPRGTTGEELGKITRAQSAKYAALIKKADIKAE
jgi:tripartite-type tricarboxylate transporter receptor subunit TctC